MDMELEMGWEYAGEIFAYVLIGILVAVTTTLYVTAIIGDWLRKREEDDEK
jgi:hypothetical protein